MRITGNEKMPQAKDFNRGNGKFDLKGFKLAIRKYQFAKAVRARQRANSVEAFFAA